MTYSITNSSNGKELKVTDKVARDFFGAFEGTKRFMCLPVNSEVDISGETTPDIYECKEYKRKKKMPGALVIRMGGIGDLVLLSPGLREMEARGELATVATLPQHVEFVKSLGFKTICIEDAGRYQFEKVIDLRFAVEPKEIGGKATWEDYTLKDRSDHFEELLGVWPVRKQWPFACEGISGLYGGNDYVAINASITASARAIPAKYLNSMCTKIVNDGQAVVLFGKSQPWNQEVLKIKGLRVNNQIDKTSIANMVNIIESAKLVITPDSGPLHIAGALGKKTLALFGCINPRTRVSYYPTVRALYPVGELPCIPCWDTHPCVTTPQEGVACMKLLDPDRVVNAARELGGF